MFHSQKECLKGTYIGLETLIDRILGSLIMNLKSESQNSKWRIQYGSLVHDFFFETLTILLEFAQERLL